MWTPRRRQHYLFHISFNIALNTWQEEELAKLKMELDECNITH